MIELKNVSKNYLNQVALDNITLTLPAGKIIGIVGENGSGKSTALKLISGLIRPSKGSVTINGEPVNRRSSKIISYLSELDTFYSFYTVKETIDFFATQFEDLDLQKANEIMKFMKLDPNKKVKIYLKEIEDD